jgi:hypothetical protein
MMTKINIKKIIYSIIGIGLVLVIANSIYQQLNKKVAKSSRIDCHKSVTVFERVYNNEALKKIQKNIEDGSFDIVLKTEPSKYMQSQLFNYVDTNEIKKYINDTFGFKSSSSELKINVLLYENDKLDPGKKNDEAKAYAGYLMFDFYLENVMIYKIQIDFMDMQGSDINKTIDCIKQSVLSI